MACAPARRVVGVTAGASSPVVGSLWAELYGVTHLGAIRALVTSLMVFATAASPFVFGVLLDLGVSFDLIAHGSVAYCVLGTLLMLLAIRTRRT